MGKKGRLLLFYQRLLEAPAASTYDEAYELICKALDAVEDEHSGVPNTPSNWLTDGRLYPPQPDRSYAVDGFPDVVWYKSFGHSTYIGSNGAIEVKIVATNEVDFTKPGANGKGVWE